MPDVIGYVNGEDLLKWRASRARRDAMELFPEDVPFEDRVRIYQDNFDLTADLVHGYEIDDNECWHVSHYTGAIFYCDEH